MQLSDFTDTDSSVLCTLSIPKRLLYSWYTQTAATAATMAKKSGKYVELLNARIKGGLVSIKSESSRVAERLMRQAHKLATRVVKARGRQRQQLLQQSYTIFMLEGEADTIEVIRKEAEEKMAALEMSHEREVADNKEEIETLLQKMIILTQESSYKPNHGRIYEDVSPRQA